MSNTNVRVKASSAHSEASRSAQSADAAKPKAAAASENATGTAAIAASGTAPAAASAYAAAPTAATANANAHAAGPATGTASATAAAPATNTGPTPATTGDSTKGNPTPFDDIAKKARPYLDKHGHAVMYGIIGIAAAVLILTIGFWPVFLLALFAAIGIAIGKFRDSGASMQAAAKSLTSSLHR